jgi:hypothetical protein
MVRFSETSRSTIRITQKTTFGTCIDVKLIKLYMKNNWRRETVAFLCFSSFTMVCHFHSDRITHINFHPSVPSGYNFHRIHFGPGAHTVSCPIGTEGFLPRVKRPGLEADHSTPVNTEVKIDGAMPQFSIFTLYIAIVGNISFGKSRSSFPLALPHYSSLRL